MESFFAMKCFRIVQVMVPTDLAAEHDIGTDSMVVLFAADEDFRLDASGESAAVEMRCITLSE